MWFINGNLHFDPIYLVVKQQQITKIYFENIRLDIHVTGFTEEVENVVTNIKAFLTDETFQEEFVKMSTSRVKLFRIQHEITDEIRNAHSVHLSFKEDDAISGDWTFFCFCNYLWKQLIIEIKVFPFLFMFFLSFFQLSLQIISSHF